MENYYIFGAHPRAYTLYQYLKTLKPERNILGFFYNNDEKNPEEIEGIRVINLNENVGGLDCSAEVFIATRGVFHEKIINDLKELGFEKITPVTPQMDTELRNQYVKDYFGLWGKTFEKIDSIKLDDNKTDLKSDTCVYIAKTVFDGDFSKPVDLKPFEKIIQAGAALAEKKLPDASYFDDVDENISKRNPQFCELTAFYWIWKHAKEDIIGLEHWRRRFILPENWIDVMQSNDIDVILPVPLCVMPSLLENYKFRHDSVVWDECMDILKKYHPEDYDGAMRFFANCNLYSPCNMIIAKREVLLEYCEWLFPVLLELNDSIGKLEDKYQNRYPGFISERLLNYFFEKNRERFNIVYADKSFLS